MSGGQIDTNPPSGTRDFLGADVARRERAFAALRDVFERHGFEPLETPAFERLDVLLGKYGEEGDKLIFKILRRGEHEETGEADLALRYDLTVPLARVVAHYSDAIVEPYKRYHIGPVWRGERPGRGRFREFTQCDVDVVGSDSTTADAEVVLAVTAGLRALGLEQFTVRVNSRKALRGLIEAYTIPLEQEDKTLIALDKLDKVGAEGVVAELRGRGLPPEAVARVAGDLEGGVGEDLFRERIAGSERGRQGLAEVDAVNDLVAANLGAGQVRFDPFLARGLSYYTGPIFEVEAGGLGASVASGGRYDELIGMFSNRDIPATGGSVGLERVLLVLDDAAAGVAPDVLVTVLDDDAVGDAVAVARRLREAGLRTDLYVGEGRLGKQLRYADRRGIRYCVLRGSDERAADEAAVKDLTTGEQVAVGMGDLVDHLRKLTDRP